MDGYHPNYPNDSEVCKQEAGWHCECCGVIDGSVATTQNGKRKGKQHFVYLVGAHLDKNDKMNPKPRLAALCPTCHGLYDHGTPEQVAKVLAAIKENRQNRKG